MQIDELIHRKPDEQVIFFLRRHPIVLISNMVLITAFAAIPFVVRWFILANDPQLFTGPVTGPAIRLMASAYALLTWLFYFATFVDYYLDAWVVTNERIVNVEQNGLFRRTVSELDLARIQDITSQVKGPVPFFFGYGDVYVQTASEEERFDFEQVKKPEEIRKRLLALVEAEKQKQEEDAMIAAHKEEEKEDAEQQG